MAQNENINLNITIDASNANKSTDNLKAKIRQLREAMAQLRAEGKENSAQYKAMAQEAGRLQDIMGDVAAETRALADDNQTLTATMQGMSTGVAVFSGLQSAAAMLGVEDKNLLEVLTKLQAAQVLLNSVNTIAKNLNKDSALMIALRSKNTKALTTDIKAETSATVAGTAATKTFTTAQATATTGAKGLSKAVKGVGTAIKSVPVVGWILAAVGALTTLLSLLKKTNDEEERGNELREEHKKKLDDIKKKYQDIRTEIKKNNDEVSDLLQYLEGDSSSILWQDAINALSTFTGLSKDYLATLKEGEATTLKNLVLDYQQAKAELAEQKEIFEEMEAGSEKFREQQQRIWRIEASIKSYVKDINAERQKGLNWEKQQAANAKARAEAEKKAKEEAELAEKQRQNSEKSRMKSLEMDVIRSHEGTVQYLNAEINLLLEQQKKEQENLENMFKSGELKAIDYMNLLFENLQEYRIKIGELVQKFNDEADKNELESIRKLEKSKSDTRIASAKEGSEEYFEALKERNDQEMAIELQDLADLHDCKLISDELYESEVDRIHAQHTKERQDIELQSLEAIQQQRNDVMDSFATVASQTSALITDMMETELEGVEQGSKKEKQIRKKYAVAEATMQIADIGISTAQSIMGAWQSTSKLVYPLNLIMGGIMTAMLAMTGLAQTAKAMKSKQEIMKASRGAYINGRSHANGGELIEAEGGEVIMSKRAVSVYGGLLSQLNSSVGGVRFPQAENNGRGVMQTTINPNDLRTIVTEVVAGTSAIPVVVSERDISTSQARVASISSYARI